MSAWKGAGRGNHKGSESKKVPVKCHNYDEITGEKLRSCQPYCRFTHPRDAGWDTAAASRKPFRPPVDSRRDIVSDRSRDSGWNREKGKEKDSSWNTSTNTNDRVSHSRKKSNTHSDIDAMQGPAVDSSNSNLEFGALPDWPSYNPDVDDRWGQATLQADKVVLDSDWGKETAKDKNAGWGKEPEKDRAPEWGTDTAKDKYSGWGKNPEKDRAPDWGTDTSKDRILEWGRDNVREKNLEWGTALVENPGWGNLNVSQVANERGALDLATDKDSAEIQRAATSSNKTPLVKSRWGKEKSSSSKVDTPVTSNPPGSFTVTTEAELRQAVLAANQPSTTSLPTKQNNVTSNVKDSEFILPSSLKRVSWDHSVHKGPGDSLLSTQPEDSTITRPALKIRLPAPIDSNKTNVDGHLPSSKPSLSALSGSHFASPFTMSHPPSSAVAEPAPVSAVTDSSLRDLSMQQQIWNQHLNVLRQTVNLSRERLRLQNEDQDRQRLMQTLWRKSGSTLPGNNSLASKLHHKAAEKESQLVFRLNTAISALREDTRSTTTGSADHWWPTPRVGVNYDQVMCILEEQLQSLQAEIPSSDRRIGGMDLDAPDTASSAHNETIHKDTQNDSLVQTTDIDGLTGEVSLLLEGVVLATEQVNNKTDLMFGAMQDYLDEKYSPTSRTRTKAEPAMIRLEELRNRYNVLEKRLSKHPPELHTQRREERGKKTEIEELKIRLEELRRQQEIVVEKQKQITEEAQQFLSTMTTPSLPDSIRDITADPAIKQRIIRELTPKLLSMVEKYRAEDLEYMAQRKATVQAEMNALNTTKTQTMRQRGLQFLEGLKSHETLTTLDITGQEIDRRWKEVTALHKLPRREATIRIPGPSDV